MKIEERKRWKENWEDGIGGGEGKLLTLDLDSHAREGDIPGTVWLKAAGKSCSHVFFRLTLTLSAFVFQRAMTLPTARRSFPSRPRIPTTPFNGPRLGSLPSSSSARCTHSSETLPCWVPLSTSACMRRNLASHQMRPAAWSTTQTWPLDSVSVVQNS